MKTLFLIVSLLFTNAAFARPVKPGLAKAPALAAGIEAAFTFAEDFAKANGKPLSEELVGFSSEIGTEGLNVKMLSLSAPTQLASEMYGCHFHLKGDGSIEDTHCHSDGARESVAYTPGTRRHSVAQFEAAAVEAANFFTKKFGAPMQITQAKMWQTGTDFEFALSFAPAGQAEKIVYLMCHPHGGHLDCHSQSRPGKNEPRI